MAVDYIDLVEDFWMFIVAVVEEWHKEKLRKAKEEDQKENRENIYILQSIKNTFNNSQ